MRKLQMVLCSAMFSTMLSGCVSSGGADEAQQEAAPVSEAVAVDAPSAEITENQTVPEVVAEAEQAAEPVEQAPKDPYKVTTFFADFTRFTIGDTAPDMYRTKQYTIVNWKARHLPEPEDGSHWTYMGGNYVLITNSEGRIQRAISGDIYYGH